MDNVVELKNFFKSKRRNQAKVASWVQAAQVLAEVKIDYGRRDRSRAPGERLPPPRARRGQPSE